VTPADPEVNLPADPKVNLPAYPKVNLVWPARKAQDGPDLTRWPQPILCRFSSPSSNLPCRSSASPSAASPGSISGTSMLVGASPSRKPARNTMPPAIACGLRPPGLTCRVTRYPCFHSSHLTSLQLPYLHDISRTSMAVTKCKAALRSNQHCAL